MTGRISSIQTLGTLDGPGVRFVVFFQGCPLRCACCHNPETWDFFGGKEYSAKDVVGKMLNYKEYFGKNGGITLSGGEPLLQSDFAAEIFYLSKENSINTCLDTSGFLLDGKAKSLLELTDYCMLDIKYTNDADYIKYTGISMKQPLEFLDYLNKNNIKTRIRQVIIPGLNDSADSVKKLNALKLPCVDEIELLPFRKLCSSKYEKMNIDFPLKDFPEATEEKIKELNGVIM